MKSVFRYIVIFSFFLNSGAFAAPHSVPIGHMMDQNPQPGMAKPQMARDLEGLDPKEGGISKGLRGSFTVRHYISGPWKGGSAVIELASDSSYAEIRIFDSDGNLQRIYSIQPKSQNARINASKIGNPIEMVNSDNAAANPAAQETPEAMNVQRSPEREAAVQAQTAQALKGERGASTSGEEAIPRARRGTVSSPAGDIREEGPPETAPKTEAAPATEVASAQPAAPKRHVIRVRRKRHRKKPASSSLDTPLSGAAPAKDEDEYYYENVVVVDKPSTAASESKTPAHKAKEEEAVEVAKAEPVAPPPPPAPAPTPAPAPSRKSKSSASKSSGGSSGSADSAGSVGSSSSAGSPSSSGSAEPARDLEHTASRTSGSIPVAAGTAASAASGKSAGASPASAYDESNLPDVTQAVTENESEATPSGKRKLESDSWKPKPTQVVALPGTPVEFPPPTSSARQNTEPVEDLTAAKQAAAKLESDGWTPKPTGAAPTDAELGLTNTASGTSQRKGRSKKGGAYDDMAPMSDQVRNGGQVGSGSGNWTPSTTSAKLNPKDEQTLAMINSLKAVQPQAPMAHINRDINNPEEGVKPFYSLEKYSGAAFGRHREFERRVMDKQNTKTSVKGYDFYIDEVDRKQEKHYLYYYKVDAKTKKAKLIATEKHEHVTFLGNYDIASEDKGKVSKE